MIDFIKEWWRDHQYIWRRMMRRRP